MQQLAPIMLQNFVFKNREVFREMKVGTRSSLGSASYPQIVVRVLDNNR